MGEDTCTAYICQEATIQNMLYNSCESKEETLCNEIGQQTQIKILQKYKKKCYAS